MVVLTILSLLLAPTAGGVSCDGNWPSSFDSSKDFISLHYDCAADPDDLMSGVADRTVLESEYGVSWMKDHTIPAIGTFGTNTNYEQESCERLHKSLWADVNGYLSAAKKGDSDETKRLRDAAVDVVAPVWIAAILAGGQVYVKEGGQADFTKMVVKRLQQASAWPNGQYVSDAGQCVHVVQHSGWNQQHYGDGVLSFMQSNTDYHSPSQLGGDIKDGNTYLQRPKNSLPVPNGFVKAATSSWLGCAWDIALEEFSNAKSYCQNTMNQDLPTPYGACLDFSDTIELLFILRIGYISEEAFYSRYLKPASSLPSISCGPSPSPTPTPQPSPTPSPDRRYITLTTTCQNARAASGLNTVSSVQECEGLCDSTSGCTGMDTDGEQCWLKSYCEGTEGSCSARSGHQCGFRVATTREYEVLTTTCQNSKAIADLQTVSSVAECEQLCDANSQCTAMDTDGGECWLKSHCEGTVGTCSASSGHQCGIRLTQALLV